MASQTISPNATASSRPRYWRMLGLFGLAVLVLCAAGVSWMLTIARSALPELDGVLPVKGLSAPVSVTRDTHGVPTIEATTLDDLFFAQGYVTAQDRLFQMDLMRRAAAGELSEIVGEPTLKHDRQQRILGIRAAAQKGVEAATDEDRAQFGAYARGVNAFIDSHRDHLPIEFRILGYAPRPWTRNSSM